MNRYEYLQGIRERVAHFHHIPGARLPLYDDNAGIDMGKYLCLVRETGFWTGKGLNDSPLQNAETLAEIAEHLIYSAQDVEELLNIITDIEEATKPMYSMTIPKANQTPEVLQIIGDLAANYRATILGGIDCTVIEFRTMRLNGADNPGELRALAAREQLLQLQPFASACDPIPSPPQPSEEENVEA